MKKCLDAKPITQAQRFRLMIDARGQISFWTAACREMGWDKNDRNLRLQKFSEIVGRELTSASEIGYLKEFDKVKAHLLAWSQPGNLDAQMHMLRQPLIRLQTAILELASPAYAAAIAHDKFGTNDLESLNEQQLTQLRDTLAARKSSKKVEPELVSQPF